MKLGACLFLWGAMLNAASSFDQRVDRFFTEYFRHFPSNGTAAGFHEYDPQLEDYSASAARKRESFFKQNLGDFQKQPASEDRDLIIARIQAELLSLQQIKPLEKNPDFYSSGLTSSIFGLMSRKFAPPEARLKSVIAREKEAPKVFAAARKNLKDTPKIYVQIALEQLPGLREFFARDVPAAFSAVQEPALLADFKSSNGAVIDQLTEYEKFLKEQVLPKANGDFRIGPENYRKKLLYEEMVDIPLERLLQIGYNDLHANQRELTEVAKKVDGSKTPLQISQLLEKDHPPAAQLLETFRQTFDGLIDFINQHKIISIPSTTRPILEETPPFMRATTFASMDTPGPYEKVATEAFFNVTLPDAKDTPEQVQEHMAAFNRGTIISTAVHEAFPGHFVQLLWFQKVQSKAKKLLMSNSNVEGWAHYTEQMMLDQGYGDGDLKLRLGQLQDALLRNARYIVGIQMHTGNMTYDQGVDYFMKEAYMTRANAVRETKRGTNDPTYLVYTLGKLQIIKLREDMRKKQGTAFTLEQFHNDFMKYGGVPVKVIRKNMLQDESPAL